MGSTRRLGTPAKVPAKARTLRESHYEEDGSQTSDTQESEDVGASLLRETESRANCSKQRLKVRVPCDTGVCKVQNQKPGPQPPFRNTLIDGNDDESAPPTQHQSRSKILLTYGKRKLYTETKPRGISPSLLAKRCQDDYINRERRKVQEDKRKIQGRQEEDPEIQEDGLENL